MVYMASPTTTTTTSQVFRSFLPKVEITKVTLEYSDRGESSTSKSREKIFDRNPHIDSGGYETRRERLEALDDLGGSQNTKIVVDLEITIPSMQSYLSVVSTSFEEDILQALEVHICRVDNREQFEQTRELGGTQLLRNIPVLNKQQQQFGVFEQNRSREIVVDGKRSQIYYHSVTFESTNGPVENLGLFAYSTFNPSDFVDAFPQQMKSTVTTSTARVGPSGGMQESILTGPIDSLWVINNGTISSTTYVTTNGEVKAVKVPKVQDFRISRKIESIPMDFSIIENEIFPNLKKDLRRNYIDINQSRAIFSEILLSRTEKDECAFFFSIDWKRIVLENSTFGGLIKDAGPSEVAYLIGKSKIQNIKILRLRVDKEQNSGSNLEDKLFDQNQIPEIIIDSGDTLHSGRGLRVGGPQQPGGQTGFIVGLERGTTMQQSHKEGISILVEKTRFAPVENRFRYFSGIDKTINKKTDGYYKYEVEIQCFDKSIEIINQKYEKLLSHIKEIEIYYEAATKLSNRTNGVPPNVSPYVDSPGSDKKRWISSKESGLVEHRIGRQAEREFEPGQINPGAFDTAANRFTKAFVEAWTIPDTTILLDTIKRVITRPDDIINPGFLQILKFFSNRDTFDVTQTEGALLDFVNPNSATPQSINVVLNLMKTLASRISSILGVVYTTVSTNNTNTEEAPEDQKKSATSTDRTFKIRNRSSDFFDSTLIPKLGFDFLGTTEPSTRFTDDVTGLKELTSTNIYMRGQEEINKFFKEGQGEDLTITESGGWLTNLPVSVNDSFATYFTPRTIWLPNKPEEHIGVSSPLSIETHTMPPPPPVDFLKVVPFSLFQRQPTTESFLKNVIDILFGTSNLVTDNASRAILSNDIASYFALYHNAIVVNTGDIIGGRAEELSTSDSGDIYYRGQAALDQVFKAGMYGSFMEILNWVVFSQENRGAIPSIKVENKRSNVQEFYNITLPDERAGTIRGKFKDLSNDEKEELLKKSPVQTKALIWLNISKGSVKGDRIQNYIKDEILNKNLKESYDYEPAFEYTTQIINKLEVLTGYNLDEDGEPMLRSPIWEPFVDVVNKTTLATVAGTVVTDIAVTTTAEALLGDKQHLCRISPYINDKLLITRNQNYDLPTYDEYFILQPFGGEVVGSSGRTATEIRQEPRTAADIPLGMQIDTLLETLEEVERGDFTAREIRFGHTFTNPGVVILAAGPTEKMNRLFILRRIKELKRAMTGTD